MTQQVPVLTVKSCGKLQQNLTPGFQFSTIKLGEFSSSRRAGEKVKISNFIDCFRLKENLPAQKIDTTVSSPDNNGLWKVSAISELWFPIQPSKKMVKLLQTGKKQNKLINPQ